MSRTKSGAVRDRHLSIADSAHLQVRSLVKRYGAVAALDGIDLEIQPGEAIGLIGPNGSGKTTMIDCIGGAQLATEGSIVLNGEDITRVSRARRARLGVGRTFQNLRLFTEMTVRENVATGLAVRRSDGSSGPHIVQEMLERFGLSEVARERASDLPYGDQRRVEMARALASYPRLLCLDEPAAGLNDLETATLKSVLNEVREELRFSLIIIDHDMTLVFGVAERVAVLDEGRKIFEGVPDEVFQQQQVVEAYLGS